MSGPRTPLLRPDRYFAVHDSPPARHALAAVACVTLVTAAGTAVLLGEFAAAVDTTVTVDNPAYPGDAFCDNPAARETPTPSGCGEPATVERDLGELVADELSWLPLAMVVAVPSFWLFEAVALHVGSGLAGGNGSFRDTAIVAGWGLAPSLLRVGVVGAWIVDRLRSVTVSETTNTADALQTVIAGVEPIGLAAAVVVALWAGVIRAYGLASVRALPLSTAGWVVGLLTVIGFGFELL